jgi:hypothetical protein
MHEPIPSIATAGGLVIFGFATGLHPGLIIAGAISCWLWIILTNATYSRAERSIIVAISGMLSSWAAPISASVIAASKIMPDGSDASLLNFPIAAIFGFIVVPILAPAMLKFGKKKTEEYTGG